MGVSLIFADLNYGLLLTWLHSHLLNDFKEMEKRREFSTLRIGIIKILNWWQSADEEPPKQDLDSRWTNIVAAMLFYRQTWTLVIKNILIVLVRHAFSTPLRCLLLPLFFTGFLSFARNLFIPASQFGIGTPAPVRSLASALQAAGGGRNRVAFINSGFAGGDIDRVINLVADQVRAEGRIVEFVSQERDLLTACRNSLRGISTCFGAAIFYASPTEGPGGLWNYSLRADGDLGSKIDMTKSNNDVEIYPLPLQHALDFAIASINQTVDQTALPKQINEYPFTDKTAQERADRIRIRYMGGRSLIFFIAIVATEE